MEKKSVITIALEKKVYADMAINLARSFLLWNNTQDISFLLVTDQEQYVRSADVAGHIDILPIQKEQFPGGFTIKLYLDQFARADKNLFIDCDCLVYASLLPVFETFRNHSFSAIGTNKMEGEFFGDIASVRKQFQLNYLPKFVGSVYYFEAGEISTSIFSMARTLREGYDQIGLVRLRQKENEEPLLAIAMAKHGKHPVEDTGKIKADRMFYHRIQTNVLKGRAYLFNGQNALPVPDYSTRTEAFPAIVHFNGHFAESFEYRAEVMRLSYFRSVGRFAADLLVWLTTTSPGRIRRQLKNSLRPLYHGIFGTRQVKPLNR